MSTKNRKIVLILVIAFLVAAIGAVALFSYLRPMRITMYVFKDSYPAGTAVTDDILVPVLVDENIVYGGKNTDASAAFITKDRKKELVDDKKNFLKIGVLKGMPLAENMLTLNNWSKIQMEMDEDKVAVTIPVDSISGVSNELTYGSRVNIYMSSSDSRGNGTELLFENMKVLAVTKDSYGSLSSATIEVSVAESLSLINAAENYSIYLGLVNGSSYTPVKKDTDNTNKVPVVNPSAEAEK